MSFAKYPLIEVIKSSFSAKVWTPIFPALKDTMYMVIITSGVMLAAGILLGLVMTVTSKDGIYPLPWFYRIMNSIINCLRSLPQMIMIILMIPVARVIIGKSYGTDACMVALAASCIPMFSRLVENACTEITKGKIEAAKSMGSGNAAIVFKVILPETLPALIRAFTVAVIAMISMSALAGSFGAGGIGDIAVRYGFERFQHDTLLACVYALVVIVTAVQLAGDFAARLVMKKRHLI